MTDRIDLGPAATTMAQLVRNTRDDDLAKPTPCADYTLGDLLDHVGGLAIAFTGAAQKDIGESSAMAPSGDASRLEPGWRERNPIYRLYHLLNHLNLFGEAYRGQVMAVASQFT